MLARLQAVLSRNMYSLHGLLALIRPEFGQVCQRLIGRVVLHARIAAVPGAFGHPVQQSPRFVLRTRSRRSVTQCVVHLPPRSTASMNSSVTRTDKFAFWNRTEL